MTSPDVYKFFASYVYKHSGILYKETDYYRLDTRLSTMMKEMGLGSVEDVYKEYQKNISETMHSLLINLATNNETYFMRDSKPFSTLVKVVLPEVLASPSSVLKVWCAGCSTGQEPYSIAMTIDQHCDPKAFELLNIYASDISTDALKKAKSGKYDGLDVQRGLPVPFLVKYFTKNQDESWEVLDKIKQKVTFRESNLLTNPIPKGEYDIVFCRNVLIYQDRENRKVILEKIYDSLKSGGYLFMGSGESIIGLDLKFKQNISDNTLIYKKE